jgi:formylglycine-generating enzyme required for sulfatase activity
MYSENTGNHPVTFVSWDDAYAYAQWAGKRLPTAEEWDVAARGLNGRIFPWGNTSEAQRVNVNHPDGGTAAVGSFADDVSAFKVYDMGGNVMEWTMTQYGNQKDVFVLKGSSWATKPFEARGANQTPGYAEYRLSHVGFRCAQSKTKE